MQDEMATGVCKGLRGLCRVKGLLEGSWDLRSS